MIRNILWEVDGTLFDTFPAITYAIGKSLKELGQLVALNVIDELLRRSFDDCMEFLTKRFKLMPSQLCDLVHHYYLDVPLEKQPPFPGALEVCEFVHEIGGKNVAITHRCLESTQILLTAHGMNWLFAGIFNAEQCYPRIPESAILLAAIDRYDMDPAETLLVCTCDQDIQAGKRAGVQTCFYRKTPLSSTADYEINHLSKLLDLLKGDK